MADLEQERQFAVHLESMWEGEHGLKAIIAAVRAEIMDEFVRTAPSQHDEREACYHRIAALDMLARKIQAGINRGGLAARELAARAELEKPGRMNPRH